MLKRYENPIVLYVLNTNNTEKGIEARRVRTEDEWKDIFRQVRLNLLHNGNDGNFGKGRSRKYVKRPSIFRRCSRVSSIRARYLERLVQLIRLTRLAARAAKDETDGKDCHDPSVLSKLPFTEATWSHVLETFHIHGSVAKLINRGLSCVFSRSFLTLDISPEPTVGKYGVSWQCCYALEILCWKY